MTAALALERPPMAPPTPPPARRPEPRDKQVLAALPSAVGAAQRFARHTLEQWGLPGLADAAEASVTELVSDAVARTGIPVEYPGYLDLYGKHLNLVVLRLQTLGDRVLVEVWTPAPHHRGPWMRRSRTGSAVPVIGRSDGGGPGRRGNPVRRGRSSSWVSSGDSAGGISRSTRATFPPVGARS